MNEYSGIIPRTYILSHCDFTANLTLSISNVINLEQVHFSASNTHSFTEKVFASNNEVVFDWSCLNNLQLRGWYSKDDVVAEWKKRDGQLGLHIHCYVSGPNQLLELAAEFRYHIFSKEMPLVSGLMKLYSIFLNPNTVEEIIRFACDPGSGSRSTRRLETFCRASRANGCFCLDLLPF